MCTRIANQTILFTVKAPKSHKGDIMPENQSGDSKTIAKSHYLTQFFHYSHLPTDLQKVSRPFCELARELEHLPDNPEKTTALRKLLEAKDCAVRAIIFRP